MNGITYNSHSSQRASSSAQLGCFSDVSLANRSIRRAVGFSIGVGGVVGHAKQYVPDSGINPIWDRCQKQVRDLHVGNAIRQPVQIGSDTLTSVEAASSAVDSGETHVRALGSTSVQSSDVGGRGVYRTDDKKPCEGSWQSQGVGLVGKMERFAPAVPWAHVVKFYPFGGPSIPDDSEASDTCDGVPFTQLRVIVLA